MSILPKIEVPSYTLTLPSTGKEVTYRPYLVKEEKLLLIALESADAEQIRQAMLNITDTCTKDLDVSTLTSYDAEYIFLKLRSVSVGATVELIKACDKCDEKNNHLKIDLEKVEVKNLKELNDMQIKIDDNLIVDIRYPKTTDKIGTHDKAADLLIQVVSNSIETIYYGEDTFSANDVTNKDMIDFVENLNTAQFNKITAVLLDVPYLGLDVEFKCKACGHKHTMELKGLIDFFM